VIPYFPQPQLTIGTVTIYAYGVFTALGLLAGYYVATRLARKRGLEPALTGRIYLTGILGGLIGGHLLYLWRAGDFSSAQFLAFWRGQAAAGLGVGALSVAFWYRRELRQLDVLALAFPVAWSVARFGCFLAHDHLGPASQSWLAVKFSAGSRLDFGLLECLAAVLIAPPLYWLASKHPRPGLQFALLLTYALAIRLTLTTLK
jgi:phosphatidylglycerol:prolipoprotein diacylglycerol transferase